MARALSIDLPNTLTELEPLLDKFQRVGTNVVLNSPGLTIGTSSKKAVKIANATYCYIEGVLVKVDAAEVAFTATTHDVVADKFAVFCLIANSAGTVTISKSADAASLGGVVFPTVPDGSVLLGFVIINPTGTGNFDATSTDLDDATVVPNAVYINTSFPFIPGLLETL
jgi:hypothetical protein